MLADPDGFDNPLLTGLREASDSTLENSPTLTRTVKAAAHAVALIERTNRPLYRAYLLKEQLRQVFHLPAGPAMRLLDERIAWAQRSRLEPFVKVARSIRECRAGIEASLRHGLSNALIESTNTKLRLLTRMAFGFRSTDALIAPAMLGQGGLGPTSLPGR